MSLPTVQAHRFHGGRGNSRGEIFRRMLQHPRYLFRPWFLLVEATAARMSKRVRHHG